MEIRITKKQMLFDQVNEMVSHEWWLIHGRVYNNNKTKYKKFKFVVDFDWFEIQEYFDKESFTKKEKNEYIANLIDSYLQFIISYDNTKDFFDVCNESINHYNKTMLKMKGWLY